MKQKAIIDSSILVKIILEKDKKLLKYLYENYEIFIPVNVLEETSFIIIRESIKEIFNEERFYKMKEIFEREKIELIEKRLEILNELTNIWRVLEINKNIFEISKSIIKKYRLLPNDALVVASAKYYNIDTLITRDGDFKKVDILKVILI